MIALKDIQPAAHALIAAHATFAPTVATRVILNDGKKSAQIEEVLRSSPGWAIVIHTPLEADTDAQANSVAIVDVLIAVGVMLNPALAGAVDIMDLGTAVKEALTNVTKPTHAENRFRLDEDKAFSIVSDDPGLREHFWFFRRKASV